MGLEEENTPPPLEEQEDGSDEHLQFYGQAILLSLARIYDALLIQIAQSDDNVAASLQDQHYRGEYLFPKLHPPQNPPPPEK